MPGCGWRSSSAGTGDYALAHEGFDLDGQFEPEIAYVNSAPSRFLVHELGERPRRHDDAPSVWDHGALRMAEYRDRWSIADVSTAFARRR